MYMTLISNTVKAAAKDVFGEAWRILDESRDGAKWRDIIMIGLPLKYPKGGLAGAVLGAITGYLVSDDHPVLGTLGGAILGTGTGFLGTSLWYNRPGLKQLWGAIGANDGWAKAKKRFKDLPEEMPKLRVESVDKTAASKAGEAANRVADKAIESDWLSQAKAASEQISIDELYDAIKEGIARRKQANVQEEL